MHGGGWGEGILGTGEYQRVLSGRRNKKKKGGRKLGGGGLQFPTKRLCKEACFSLGSASHARSASMNSHEQQIFVGCKVSS